jgi:hippurate hydrolase
MHNWPGQPVGTIALRPGPMMAAFDIFEITVTGKGAHAAMPHLGNDPVLAASAIVTALQDRGQLHDRPPGRGGDLGDPVSCRRRLERDPRAGGASRHHPCPPPAGAGYRRSGGPPYCRGDRRRPRRRRQGPLRATVSPTINDPAESERAASAAVLVVDEDNIDRDPAPSMGSEDFAFVLLEKPGCYVWIGHGPGEGGCGLHNPRYDFNDAILPLGASYWSKLVESVLP